MLCSNAMGPWNLYIAVRHARTWEMMDGQDYILDDIIHPCKLPRSNEITSLRVIMRMSDRWRPTIQISPHVQRFDVCLMLTDMSRSNKIKSHSNEIEKIKINKIKLCLVWHLTEILTN